MQMPPVLFATFIVLAVLAVIPGTWQREISTALPRNTMIAIFSCHAVLCILVAPVWSSPVPSSKVADANRKALNPVRNAVLASLTRAETQDEGSLSQNGTDSTTAASVLLHTAKPGSSVASNFLANLVQNNNAVHMAFEGEAPQENYANLPYTPIMDYAFIKPDNSSDAAPNWQDTLANLYKHPNFQNGGVVKLPPIKIVGAGSESKFPLVLEMVAQRIQSMFSTYAHEDLSRPPTWDSAQQLANRTTSTAKPTKKPIPTTSANPYTTRKPLLPTKATPHTTRRPISSISTIKSTLHTTRKPSPIPSKTTKKVTRATTRKPTHTTTKYLSQLFQQAEYAVDSQYSDLPEHSSELIDVTFTKPISVENDTYIYVGEGDDEFDRGVHRRKPRIFNTFA